MSERQKTVLRFAAAIPLVLLVATMIAFVSAVQSVSDSSAHAQEPDPTALVTAHAAAFMGSASVRGEPAPDGTRIEALIGDVVCGETLSDDGRYSISVKAGFGMGRDYQEGCGRNGNEVAFRSGGLLAGQLGRFVGGGAQALDLGFGTAGTPPSQLPGTGSGGAPAAEPGVLAQTAVIAGIAGTLGVLCLAGKRLRWRPTRSLQD